MTARWLVWFLVWVSLPALAADDITVLMVGKNALAVSVRVDRPWRVNDYACVVRSQKEIACGNITKVSARGAILALKFQEDHPIKGDIVLPKGRTPAAEIPNVMATPVSVEADTRQFNVALGMQASLSYLIPALQIQFHLAPQVALGVLTGYVSASTTNYKVNALPLVLSLSYYGRGDFEGPWLQFGVGAYLFNITGVGVSENPLRPAVMFTGGWRFQLPGAFNLGVAAGLQYLPSPATSTVALDFSSLQPMALVDLGYKF